MARPARLLSVLAIATVSALVLSGCTGNAVTVSGQGYASGSKSRSLECGETGQVAMGKQGTGKLTVSVTDGDGNRVFANGDFGAGQDGDAVAVDGEPGTWTLKVSTGFGYFGQWAVTLSC